VGEGRKRKRDQDEEGPQKKKLGLDGLPGWERRSRSIRNEKRWKRKVVRWETREDGRLERKENEELTPVPEGFDMGKEKRGMDMNNSGRLRNNFGLNREALFPTGPGMKSETRNWMASLTKTGCVACRDEEGTLNHKGRYGLPVTLVVGDVATPNVVGYTGRDRNGGKGDSCA
jgi:hypothetical protein